MIGKPLTFLSTLCIAVWAHMAQAVPVTVDFEFTVDGV